MKKRRVLLKISGEAFAADNQVLCANAMAGLVNDLKQGREQGIEIAIVVGGGNFLRGATVSNTLLKRITADHMGILATILNGLALRDALEAHQVPVRLYSAVAVAGIAPVFNYSQVINDLKQNIITIFAGGTGNPFVTTDTGASLRAIEIEADVLLKATKVDGVFDKDPNKYSDAKLYKQLKFDEVLQKELQVMDLSAFCQCRDYNIPIQVFNLFKKGALLNALLGAHEGTIVSH